MKLIIKLLIITVLFILFFYFRLELHAGEQKMFEMSSYSEWGGLLIEFSDGAGSSSSFTINKDDKIIKITAPNKKGSFEWNKVKLLQYTKNENNTGELTVFFVEQYPGTENGKIIIGKIDNCLWNRIIQNTMGEIEVSEN